ncbi:peptidase inhibitor family I36 protein [Amycolatopsis sp. H20-H5]|uniref:peptidase inhibitor family I36 protein n=1 Tax=Amycolatopsis sp. H20-H5 TaxID=3046309 RepID=UPI002DB6591C|nr:peptidase inhibitor family I36 protein [Amycolatopsis sp. H20-H5]MEC3976600.1 peptidase inhibitor family I36 protein [Amycolatopsis sp. H20-H5]
MLDWFGFFQSMPSPAHIRIRLAIHDVKRKGSNTMKIPRITGRVATVAGAVAVAAVMSGVTVGAANAAANVAGPECAKGTVCLWQHSNYKGDSYTLPAGNDDSDLGKSDFDNKASSVYNHTKDKYCLYQDKNFSGKKITINPGKKVSSLGKFSDHASSIKAC